MKARNVAVAMAIAAAALAAGGVPAASAAMKALTLETAKGPLPVGAEVVLSSPDMILASASGNDECETNVIAGTVTSNPSKKTTLSFGSTSFTGGEGMGSLCTDTDPLGPVEMTGEELPWALTLSAAKGTGQLKGTKKVAIIENHVEESPHGACFFEAAKIETTFAPTGTTAEPFSLQIKEQVMKRNHKMSSGVCPNTAMLSGTFTATSEGEQVLAHT
jgi:hypothetical protein